MNRNDELLTVLYLLLADELAAVNRHYEMCESQDSCNLLLTIRKKGKNVMQDAEWLIDRIVFLVDTPSESSPNTKRIGNAVSEMIRRLPN